MNIEGTTPEERDLLNNMSRYGVIDDSIRVKILEGKGSAGENVLFDDLMSDEMSADDNIAKCEKCTGVVGGGISGEKTGLIELRIELIFSMKKSANISEERDGELEECGFRSLLAILKSVFCLLSDVIIKLWVWLILAALTEAK